MIFDENGLINFAEKLGHLLEAGDVLILTGELAAGKTTFTKGIAKGLGIQQMVKSPTFTIVREYEGGRLPLYHMDIYRVGDDPDSFDLDSYLESAGVTIIEWGELLGPDLPENYLAVQFIKTDEKHRELILSGHGQRAESFMQKLSFS